jgi:Rrf2 family iron-sulfur cluster assembly transcriptional regulator
MRLSTRGRYGLRAMIDIALYGAEGPVNLKEISVRQEISMDYLEQLLRRLRAAGLVRSVRGPHGGFALAKPSEKVHVWEIIAALEPDIAPVFCVDEKLLARVPKKHCKRMGRCATHLLWLGLAEQIRSYLLSRSLRDLVETSARICNESTPGEPVMFQI